ncbi:MAG: glycosyltransferase, partial [Myxococcota bacterium]
FDRMSHHLKGSVSRLRFNQELSDVARAGADFMLMPSRYEPCGLPQLECPRFGTLPIVRRTGGLADTVEELNGTSGNGFVFHEIRQEHYLAAVERAIGFYRRPSEFRFEVLARVMRESVDRFSLKTTTEAYQKVYRDLLGIDDPVQAFAN